MAEPRNNWIFDDPDDDTEVKDKNSFANTEVKDENSIENIIKSLKATNDETEMTRLLQAFMNYDVAKKINMPIDDACKIENNKEIRGIENENNDIQNNWIFDETIINDPSYIKPNMEFVNTCLQFLSEIHKLNELSSTNPIGAFKTRKLSIHLACEKGDIENVKAKIELDKSNIDACDILQMTPILYACKFGQLEIVKLLLEENCDIETYDVYKKRSIHYACERGDAEIVEALLVHKCDFEIGDTQSLFPIHYACKNGHIDVVKLLLKWNCDINKRDCLNQLPIHHACVRGNPEIVRLLLHGKNLEEPDIFNFYPMHYAGGFTNSDKNELIANFSPAAPLHDQFHGVNNNLMSSSIKDSNEDLIEKKNIEYRLEIIKMLYNENCKLEIRNFYSSQIIHKACENGWIEILKFLLENKCDIEAFDVKFKRPIHFAVENGRKEIVILLIEKNCHLDTWDSNKQRPIHMACRKGHEKIVELLLDKKCILEEPDEKEMLPIHYACISGNENIVKSLLQRKVNIETFDKNGRLPIHYAIENGHMEIVQLLIRNNCKLSFTKDYKSPLTLSIETGNEDLIDLVKQHL